MKNGCLYFIPQCGASVPQKDKFALCVAVSDRLCYLINSCDDKRPYRHELDSVVYVDRTHLAMLKYRSYLNVTKVCVLSQSDIDKAIEKGEIPNNLWLGIKKKVSESRTLQRKYKEIIENQTKGR